MGLYSFATPRVIAARIKAGRVNKDCGYISSRITKWEISGTDYCISSSSGSFSFRGSCRRQRLGLHQQRGPTAAKLYAHRREDKLTSGTLNSILPFGEEAHARGSSQEVVIIEGGFTNWVREFKDDERLVEGYNPAVWSSSY
ncbi:hypothetical protein PSTT_06563 [Puccinia striiformis]|uniref:Uncharacterized protein n=1 Tax=Puccinia striiformis TaxID=27350 RepID=A0A2S4VJV7_9BASI|nr:hypothetical protein PSTT_06563 [Puccinia striiformis]